MCRVAAQQRPTDHRGNLGPRRHPSAHRATALQKTLTAAPAARVRLRAHRSLTRASPAIGNSSGTGDPSRSALCSEVPAHLFRLAPIAERQLGHEPQSSTTKRATLPASHETDCGGTPGTQLDAAHSGAKSSRGWARSSLGDGQGTQPVARVLADGHEHVQADFLPTHRTDAQPSMKRLR